MKKRRWVREGDIVLVSPWEMQSDERGDIVFRYTQNQAFGLQRKGLLDFE
jgi:translation initiation factor 1A